MSNNFARVSKENLLEFARNIYKQALCSYSDLEDPVCISETNKFFEDFKETDVITHAADSSRLTFSSSIYGGSLPQGTCFVGYNPTFSYTVANQSSTSSLNPTEQQLMLFDTIDYNEYRTETSTYDFDSNEGHVNHNF